MANINKGVRPQLADIKCSRITFQPGDRILVRVYHKFDDSEKEKLKKSITKWAGCEVEVLIYDATLMDISVDRDKSRLVIP
jgi:hypothetical protein